MTGSKQLQLPPPLHSNNTSTAAAAPAGGARTTHTDALRPYITAKDVAHKRLSGASVASISSSDAFERSHASAGSPRSSSASPSAASTATAATAMSGRSSASSSAASPGIAPNGQEYILKVVLIGDSGVGKSNLIMRFTKNKFAPESVQTVGFEFATKMIRVGDRRIKAQLWDTAGQDRFQSLTAAYYKNAVGAMLVYDITRRASFEHIVHWLTQVQTHAHASLVLLLVGNKCDVAHLPQSRQVSTLEAARFAALHHMEFVEASAFDGTNVTDAFKRLIVPVGRLLSPTHPHAAAIAQLPRGWRRVLSRTRPGEFSYENQYTKERIAFAPKEPAKPSQQRFDVSPPAATTATIRGSSGATSRTSASSSTDLHPAAAIPTASVTVTRASLQLQHQKAFLAQQQSPPCGVCAPAVACTIL